MKIIKVKIANKPATKTTLKKVTSKQLIKKKVDELGTYNNLKELLNKFIFETTFNLKTVIEVIAKKYSKIFGYEKWLIESELQTYYVNNF